MVKVNAITVKKQTNIRGKNLFNKLGFSDLAGFKGLLRREPIALCHIHSRNSVLECTAVQGRRDYQQ
jgi:hypothetical protein